VRGSLTLTTDASGRALTVIVPGGGLYGYAQGTYSAGWTLGSTWGQLNGNDFVLTNAAEIRIVSMGAKFTSIASATNCSGLLNFFSHTNPVVSGTYVLLNGNYPEVQQTSLKSGTELTWIAKPCNGAASHSFRPATDFTNTMTNFDWTALGIELVGGPASLAVAYIEVVVNVEFTLNKAAITTTGLPGALTKPRPSNPVALQAQSTVQSAVSSFIEGGVKSTENFISKAVNTALSSVEDFGLSFLGL
jgi:hypothetical protein